MFLWNRIPPIISSSFSHIFPILPFGGPHFQTIAMILPAFSAPITWPNQYGSFLKWRDPIKWMVYKCLYIMENPKQKMDDDWG